jgi:predicted transcriptional regulator
MVVPEVRSLTEALDDATPAMKTARADREARISFVSPESLWQVLAAKRWELLKTMGGSGSMSIREAAPRVGRDAKAVHGDVKAPLDAGALS